MKHQPLAAPDAKCLNCLDFLCSMLARLARQEKDTREMVRELQAFKATHTPDLET